VKSPEGTHSRKEHTSTTGGSRSDGEALLIRDGIDDALLSQAMLAGQSGGRGQDEVRSRMAAR